MGKRILMATKLLAWYWLHKYLFYYYYLTIQMSPICFLIVDIFQYKNAPKVSKVEKRKDSTSSRLGR